MNAFRILVQLTIALSPVLLSGCGGISSPSTNTNESWSGVVTPSTGVTEEPQTYNFNVGRNGEMSARLTALNPSAALVGLALGQQINGLCNAGLNLTNFAGLNRDVLVTPIYQRGNYCIQVFNGGGVTQPTTYTLQVNHP